MQSLIDEMEKQMAELARNMNDLKESH